MQSFESLSHRGQLYRLRRLSRTALQQYPLQITRLTPLQHEHNTTWRVWTSDNRSYVLRIHRPGGQTTEAIQSELLWLVALHQDTRLDIPQPIPTKNGALLTIIADDGVPELRVCVLFQWISGRFLYHHLTPSHLEHVGRFSARLHEHTAQWSFPSQFVRGRVDSLTAGARHIAYDYEHTNSLAGSPPYPTEADAERCLRLVTELCSPEAGAVVNRAIHQVRKVFNELGSQPDTFGLIHADLHQENYFFHQGRVCAIDFDDCGFGHYLYDLSVTLIEIYQLPHYAALRTAFLAGYRQVRPLPIEYEVYFDTFFALRCLQVMMWVIESREHPTFRDRWERWVQAELKYIQSFIGEM